MVFPATHTNPLMQPIFATFALLLAATPAFAQSQRLLGAVEDVQNTANQFYLECTQIPVVSTAVDLNLWLGQEAILDVTNVGTAQAPVLRVDAIAATTKVFDMGNLRIGQTSRWEVRAAAGSLAFLFLDFTASTGYSPFGAHGTWLLGPGAATLAFGSTNALNIWQFDYPVPSIPALVGASLTGQALVGTNGAWTLSNPDCRILRQ